MSWELLGIWFSTAMTLFILSFLYRDNPFFRVAEHVFVGASLGYSAVLAIWKVIIPDWWVPLTAGQLWMLVPGILGILALTRLHPRYAWLSRPAFAFVMGYGAGVAIPTAVEALVIRHSQATVSPIVKMAEGRVDLSLAGLFGAFSNLLVVVIVVCILIYFFFSIEHRGPARIAARLGILFLMVEFGIAYGNTVMGRMWLLYGRFFELRENSGSDAGFATPILLVLVVAGLALYERLGRVRQA